MKELILFIIIIIIEFGTILYLTWKNQKLTYYIKMQRKNNELNEIYGDPTIEYEYNYKGRD